MKLFLTRDVKQSECHWLNDDMTKGTIVYSYEGCTYGCVSYHGRAVTLVDGEEPFFELPRDALAHERKEEPMKYEDMKAIIGRRVEIPVHYDLWMQGARFGKITARRQGKGGTSDYVLVKIDHPQVKNCLKVWSHDIDYMKLI